MFRFSKLETLFATLEEAKAAAAPFVGVKAKWKFSAKNQLWYTGAWGEVITFVA